MTIIVGVTKGIVLNNSTFAPCICKILGICYSPTLSSFWEFGWLFCSLWDSRLYMCFHRNRATNLIYYVALWLGQEDAPSYWSFNCICNSSSELFPTDSESIHSYVVRCKLISAPLFLYYCGLDYDGRVPTFFFFLFSILKHIHVWKCNILPYVLWWTGHELLVFCFFSNLHGTSTKHIHELPAFAIVPDLVLKFACEVDMMVLLFYVLDPITEIWYCKLRA